MGTVRTLAARANERRRRSGGHGTHWPSCKSTPGVFGRRRGGPSSVGMGVGRGLELDGDPKVRDRSSATAIQSIGFH